MASEQGKSYRQFCVLSIFILSFSIVEMISYLVINSAIELGIIYIEGNYLYYVLAYLGPPVYKTVIMGIVLSLNLIELIRWKRDKPGYPKLGTVSTIITAVVAGIAIYTIISSYVIRGVFNFQGSIEEFRPYTVWMVIGFVSYTVALIFAIVLLVKKIKIQRMAS
nr:hypothetical protein [Candidatus Sigynarchaeum springense]